MIYKKCWKRWKKKFDGGSMASMIASQRAAELTRARVYELSSYLGFEGEVLFTKIRSNNNPANTQKGA